MEGWTEIDETDEKAVKAQTSRRDALKKQKIHKLNQRLAESNKELIVLPEHRPTDDKIYYICAINYTFARVIVDEAHALRNPNTFLAESILVTKKLAIHFLTATPMLNHSKDLRGYLHQIFREEWKLELGSGAWLEVYEEDFDPSAVKVNPEDDRFTSLLPPRDGTNLALYDAYDATPRFPIWVFDPRNFNSCGNSRKWSSSVTRKIVPPILNILELHIGPETEIDLQNGKRIVVGSEVPLCQFYTVQLEHNPRERTRHDEVTLAMLSRLGMSDSPERKKGKAAETAAVRKGLDDQGEEGFLHAGIFRYLKHATLEPRLSTLTQLNHSEMSAAEKKQASKERVNSWTGHDVDNGASMFFFRTRDGEEYSPPIDRVSMAKYLAAGSTKSRYALGIIGQNLSKSEKTILVFEYPMCLW